MGDHPPLDIDRVVAVFDRHHVQYLLVGGVAARFHGSERLTEDVDVLPDDDDENLRRLGAALTELGAFLRVGGLSDDEARALPVQLDAPTLRGMEVSTWRTTAGDLDVLRSLRVLVRAALPLGVRVAEVDGDAGSDGAGPPRPRAQERL